MKPGRALAIAAAATVAGGYLARRAVRRHPALTLRAEAPALPVAPDNAGSVECPACHATWSDLLITPAGICVDCAVGANPSPKSEPYSDPFWILSPAELKRLEPEIERLAAESERQEKRLADPNLSPDGPYYAGILTQIEQINREFMLLLQLYATSRQFHH